MTACPNCGHDPEDLTIQVNRATVTEEGRPLKADGSLDVDKFIQERSK
jgi:hypothetical protein